MSSIISVGEILFDIYGMEKRLGGAPFNFIYHIIKFTGSGNIASRIGDDNLGKMILEFFQQNSIPQNLMQIDNIHPTGTARPTLNEKKIPEWVIDSNSAYDFIEITEEIKDLVNKSVDCIYFGTLAQRNEKSKAAINYLMNFNTKLFYDLNLRQNFYSKEIIEASLNAASIVKMNIEEMQLIFKYFEPEAGIQFSKEKCANYLIDQFDIELLCVTMGENGADLFNKNRFCHYQVFINDHDLVDTVGAGDAYAAVLCIGCLKNWNIEKINKLACEFAAEIIKVKGALPTDTYVYEKFKSKTEQG